MPVYLEIPEIRGSVTTEGYKDFIQLEAVESGGVSNYVDMTVGETLSRFSSRPDFEHLSFIKVMDDSSPYLSSAVTDAEVFSHVTLHYVSLGAPPHFTYSTTTLSNVAPCYYKDVSFEGAKPRELIVFAYSKIERSFMPRDRDNEILAKYVAGYDLEAGSKL